MEKLRQSFDNIDVEGDTNFSSSEKMDNPIVPPSELEDRFFERVAYSSNDPDYTWHLNFSTSEDGSNESDASSSWVPLADVQCVQQDQSVYTEASDSATDNFANDAHQRRLRLDRITDRNDRTGSGGRRLPFSKKFRRRIPLPPDCYFGYQLVGDDNILKFSQYYLHAHPPDTERDSDTHLGYCIKGQTLHELKDRIIESRYRLLDKVILLIGGNDLINGTEVENMINRMDEILKILINRTDRIVILTVPPIPNVDLRKTEIFNKHLLQYSNNKFIFTIDLASIFITYNNKICIEYYEVNNPMELNEMGLKLIQKLIEIRYFDKLPRQVRKELFKMF